MTACDISVYNMMMSGGRLLQGTDYLSAFTEFPHNSIVEAKRFRMKILLECNKCPKTPPLPIDICSKGDTVEVMATTIWEDFNKNKIRGKLTDVKNMGPFAFLMKSIRHPDRIPDF